MAEPIGQFALSDEDTRQLGAQGARVLEVFAAKVPYPLRGYPDAWRAHYWLREVLEDGTVFDHHLAQRQDSTMYVVPGHEKHGATAVDMLGRKKLKCLKIKPRWKRSDAFIPLTAQGEMMTFVKQLTVPKRFAQLGSLFFFAHAADGPALSWTVFQQDMTLQTAEDHYRMEEQVAEFEVNRKDLDRVTALIRAGDSYFHEYVLESPFSTPEILNVLMRFAKTKAMRAAVQKKLDTL